MITPMVLFAIIFSALIHDVDHRGVSNVQLAKEDEEMAALYQNKSIAEQNSLDIAWDLLMEPEYDQLRSYLFLTEKDLIRFRQVIVNVVLATDIFDKVSVHSVARTGISRRSQRNLHKSCSLLIHCYDCRNSMTRAKLDGTKPFQEN
jgi:3'5'-cyclic nucleotide phosphodiesterase